MFSMPARKCDTAIGTPSIVTVVSRDHRVSGSVGAAWRLGYLKVCADSIENAVGISY